MNFWLPFWQVIFGALFIAVALIDPEERIRRHKLRKRGEEITPQDRKSFRMLMITLGILLIGQAAWRYFKPF